MSSEMSTARLKKTYELNFLNKMLVHRNLISAFLINSTETRNIPTCM